MLDENNTFKPSIKTKYVIWEKCAHDPFIEGVLQYNYNELVFLFKSKYGLNYTYTISNNFINNLLFFISQSKKVQNLTFTISDENSQSDYFFTNFSDDTNYIVTAYKNKLDNNTIINNINDIYNRRTICFYFEEYLNDVFFVLFLDGFEFFFEIDQGFRNFFLELKKNLRRCI